MRRSRQLVLQFLSALAVVMPALPQAPSISAAERELFVGANADRAQHGLASLTWDPALARAARAHVVRLLHEPGDLEHQYPGEPDLVRRAGTAGARFSTVAENLARADLPPAAIEDGWMHSPPHRANLLNPSLDAIGISVLNVRGRLFAVEDFSRVVPVQSLLSIERDVARSLLVRGLSVVSLSDTARQACRSADQSPVDPARGSPAAVIQWDGPDPGSLPSELLDELTPRRVRTLGRTEPFRTALVGACPAQQTAPGFSGYRVAVLLF